MLRRWSVGTHPERRRSSAKTARMGDCQTSWVYGDRWIA